MGISDLDRGRQPRNAASLEGDERMQMADRVNVLARSVFAIKGLGEPDRGMMDFIISQTLGSVSPDDLRSSNGLSNATLGRISDLVANVTQAGAPRNRFAGPDPKVGDPAAGPLAGLKPGGYHHSLGAALAARRDASDEAQGASSTSRSNSAAYNQAFLGAAGDPTFLRSVGIQSPAIGRQLAALGFKSPEQIREIANDARSIGLDPNRAAVPVAELRKAAGTRKRHEDLLGVVRRYGDGMREVSALEEQARRTKDADAKARLQKEAGEMKRAVEERVQREQEEKRVRPAERVPMEKLMRQIQSKGYEYQREHGLGALRRDNEPIAKRADAAPLNEVSRVKVATLTPDAKSTKIDDLLDDAAPVTPKTEPPPNTKSAKAPEEPAKPAAPVKMASKPASGPKPT